MFIWQPYVSTYARPGARSRGLAGVLIGKLAGVLIGKLAGVFVGLVMF